MTKIQRLLLNPIYSFFDIQLFLKSTGKLTPSFLRTASKSSFSCKYHICDHQHSAQNTTMSGWWYYLSDSVRKLLVLWDVVLCSSRSADRSCNRAKKKGHFILEAREGSGIWRHNHALRVPSRASFRRIWSRSPQLFPWRSIYGVVTVGAIKEIIGLDKVEVRVWTCKRNGWRKQRVWPWLLVKLTFSIKCLYYLLVFVRKYLIF